MDRRQAMGILGLSDGFTESELRSAYRKACMECHPDQVAKSNMDPDIANDMMREINEAYSTLKAGMSTPDEGSRFNSSKGYTEGASPGDYELSYNMAVNLMVRAMDDSVPREERIELYLRALKLFNEISPYRDSSTLAQFCSEEIEAMNHFGGQVHQDDGVERSNNRHDSENRYQADDVHKSEGAHKRRKMVAVVTSVSAVALIALALFIAVPNATHHSAKVINGALSGAQVGSHVYFGTYEQDGSASNGAEEIEWRVLAFEDNRALLISEYGLDSQIYNSDGLKFPDWETSDLRAWLTGDFAFTAITPGEAALIDGEIFLLTRDELLEYMPTGDERICYPTVYAQSRGVVTFSNGACCWYTGSPSLVTLLNGEYGMLPKDAWRAGYVSEEGGFDYNSSVDYSVVDRGPAVRPAVWVRI